MKKKILILLIGLWLVQVCSPKPEDYNTIKSNLALEQKRYQNKFATAAAEEQEKILIQGQSYVFHMLVDSLFPCWLGTPWNFHGTSQNPQSGSIACGYFVTTLLRDAGFDVPRIAWAQQASETVIKKIGVDIRRFRNKPIEDLIAYVNQNGDGLYLVGLDCHVGFIYKKGDKIRFVHSSYYKDQLQVVSEIPKGNNPLNDSKYRVIGKLLEQEMMTYWITGGKFE